MTLETHARVDAEDSEECYSMIESSSLDGSFEDMEYYSTIESSGLDGSANVTSVKNNYFSGDALPNIGEGYDEYILCRAKKITSNLRLSREIWLAL